MVEFSVCKSVNLNSNMDEPMRVKPAPVISYNNTRVCLKKTGQPHLRSPGIDHPTKTKFGFTVNGETIDFDNLKVYAP